MTHKVVTVDGQQVALVPIGELAEFQRRELGAFQVSTQPGGTVLTAKDKVPGPFEWETIGGIDVTEVEPAAPGAQAGFPKNWIFVPPGGIDWSCVIKPTGIVEFMGVRITARELVGLQDAPEGNFTVAVWLGEVPVGAAIMKSQNMDSITGDKDIGVDMQMTSKSLQHILLHGVSSTSSLSIVGKVIPHETNWQVVRVSPSVFARPDASIEHLVSQQKLASGIFSSSDYKNATGMSVDEHKGQG